MFFLMKSWVFKNYHVKNFRLNLTKTKRKSYPPASREKDIELFGLPKFANVNVEPNSFEERAEREEFN